MRPKKNKAGIPRLDRCVSGLRLAEVLYLEECLQPFVWTFFIPDSDVFKGNDGGRKVDLLSFMEQFFRREQQCPRLPPGAPFWLMAAAPKFSTGG